MCDGTKISSSLSNKYMMILKILKALKNKAFVYTISFKFLEQVR